MVRFLSSGGFLCGLIIGCLAGAAYKAAQITRKNHAEAKAAVPKAKTAAMGATRKAASRFALLAVAVLIVVAYAVGVRVPRPGTPPAGGNPVACASAHPPVVAQSSAKIAGARLASASLPPCR
jgi:hypothetical protein